MKKNLKLFFASSFMLFLLLSVKFDMSATEKNDLLFKNFEALETTEAFIPGCCTNCVGAYCGQVWIECNVYYIYYSY